MFHALWEQEYTRRRFTVTRKDQGNLPQIGDIVLFKNEPIYKNPNSAARVEQLLRRKNGDVYVATISYCLEVGGWKIVVDRHLNQLFPFMNLETQNPQKTVHSLTWDSTEARNLAPAPSSDQSLHKMNSTQNLKKSINRAYPVTPLANYSLLRILLLSDNNNCLKKFNPS